MSSIGNLMDLSRFNDFLRGRDIQNAIPTNLGTVAGNNAIIDPSNFTYGRYADAFNIATVTDRFIAGIVPPQTQSNQGLFRLPTYNINFGPGVPGVPDVGYYPEAPDFLSATTQFQSDLPSASPNISSYYPFGANASPVDFLNGTSSYMNQVTSGTSPNVFGTLPYNNTANDGVYRPLAPQYLNPTGNGYGQGSGTGTTQKPALTQQQLFTAIRNNPFKLPDIIPAKSLTETASFIGRFNKLSESQKVDVRRRLANPTQVDEAILNASGIDENGGAYDQGKVNNPFLYNNFLTDTNPYSQYKRGLVVTNGNENGKVKGTPVSDLLIGTVGRNNIMDGQGGQDTLFGSILKDLANVRPGDRVSLNAGEDLAFYDFTVSHAKQTRTTIIDGAADNDILVLRVGGNPTLESNIPKFTMMTDGSISVALNGVQVITRNIERFIVVDTDGNIGSTFDAKTQTS